MRAAGSRGLAPALLEWAGQHRTGPQWPALRNHEARTEDPVCSQKAGIRGLEHRHIQPLGVPQGPLLLFRLNKPLPSRIQPRPYVPGCSGTFPASSAVVVSFESGQAGVSVLNGSVLDAHYDTNSRVDLR